MWPFAPTVKGLQIKLKRCGEEYEYWHKEEIRCAYIVYNMGNDEMFRDPYKWAARQANVNVAANRKRACQREEQKIREQLSKIKAQCEVQF